MPKRWAKLTAPHCPWTTPECLSDSPDEGCERAHDQNGRIRATFLQGGGETKAERTVPWTVRATEGTIDRRAARGEAQLREIAGTDAAPADLSMAIRFSPLDGRRHFADLSVRNGGASPSPGRTYLVATVDWDGILYESNETNNEASVDSHAGRRRWALVRIGR